VTDQPPVAEPPRAEPATCYRHPDREAHIRCTRCERRICPDCMIPAAVGFQCPECVREGNKDVRQARTVFGGAADDNPGVVSKVLIAINVVAYVAQQVSNTFTTRFFDIGLAIDPATGETVGVADGEVYRLLTSAFLHGGIVHLLLNMYAIYLFGPQLEAALGRVRFITLYVLSALGGSAVSYAFAAPNQPSLGASGAVFGLLGAYLVVSRKLRRDTTAVMVLLAINFAYGFLVPRIDWRAHVGGLIAGALVAVAMVYAPRERRTLVQVAGCVAVLLLIVAVVAWRTQELTGT
jgi:membrane associated rhomboid family serine protease